MLAKPMLNQLLLFGDSQFQRGHSLVALLQHLYRNKLDGEQLADLACIST